MNGVSINNDVLTEVSLSIETGLVRWGWLVDRPVVVWWVLNWVAGLDEVVVHSINDNISLSKIFISLHTVVMSWGWLVHRPVVIWWVVNWVGGLGKLGGDWAWLVSHKVLESSSGDVGVEESGEVISVTLLGKLGGDWRRLVGDKVLEGTSGDV